MLADDKSDDLADYLVGILAGIVGRVDLSLFINSVTSFSRRAFWIDKRREKSCIAPRGRATPMA